MKNTNCLENWKCPKCGSIGPFTVQASCLLTLHDNGTEDERDIEWEDENYCQCVSCSYEATVKDFSNAEQNVKDVLKDIIFDLPIFSENGPCLERLAKKHSIPLQPETEQEAIAALIFDRLASHV